MINIVVVTYKQVLPLDVMIKSIFNQTSDKWKLWVIHDGENEEYLTMMERIRLEYPQFNNKFITLNTSQRYDDYGHSLRDMAIRDFDIPDNEYLLLTNGDNYYVPVFVDYMEGVIANINNCGVVCYDMVHSHKLAYNTGGGEYGFLDVHFEKFRCDIGSFIVRVDIAKNVGFNYRHHDADAEFIEDIKRYQSVDFFNIVKMNKCLFVHN